MEASKPVIVIVGGGWHVPDSYKALTQVLQDRQYEVQIPRLESVSDIDPTSREGEGSEPLQLKGLVEDTAVVRQHVKGLIEQGRKVVAVCHSYGGQVGTNALYGLGQKTEKPGEAGVSSIIYVCASALSKEETMITPIIAHGHLERMGSADPPPFTNRENGSIWPQDPRKILFNNIESPAVDHAISTFKLWNPVCMMTPIENVAWLEIPTTYVYATRDITLPVEYQRWMVEKMREQGVEVKTAELDTSHSPYATKTKELADIIANVAAGKFEQRAEIAWKDSKRVKHPYDSQENQDAAPLDWDLSSESEAKKA